MSMMVSKDGVPAMFVGVFAKLYSPQTVVECGYYGTGFAVGEDYVFVSGVEVVDLGRRRRLR